MAPTTTLDGSAFRLLTVNKVPERAFRLVGRVATDLKNNNEILLEHVGNAAALEEISDKMTALRPNILMCASMWTPEEAARAFEIGKGVVGEKLITHAIPQGLQAEKGPDAVVDHLKESLPSLVKESIIQGTTEDKL